jgi:hypothetical protein
MVFSSSRRFRHHATLPAHLDLDIPHDIGLITRLRVDCCFSFNGEAFGGRLRTVAALDICRDALIFIMR